MRILNLAKNTSAVVLCSLIVISALALASNLNAGTTNNYTVFAQSQPSQYNNTNSTRFKSLVDNLETRRAHVGDIDIAYKIFGKGQPLLLIPGLSMTMGIWEPVVLDKLSSNHTIIISDNHGIGNTTAGNNKTPSSIQQFANDTAGLIDALGIQKPVDILGFSMGGLSLKNSLFCIQRKSIDL